MYMQLKRYGQFDKSKREMLQTKIKSKSLPNFKSLPAWSFFEESLQPILSPNSVKNTSILSEESALSVQTVQRKSTLDVLTITYEKLPSSLFAVLVEFSLIDHPIIFNLIEICEIKGAAQLLGKLAVQLSFSVKGVVAPEAIIGRLTDIIVECASPAHLILPKLTLVESSIVENQLSFALFHVTQHASFVLPALLI